MIDLDLIGSLALEAQTRIVLLVIDGLGGLGKAADGPTTLEAADTPNLDRLALEGTCGLHEAVGPGISPGSGPGHLALFGYDPLVYRIGRGVLSALGVDFPLRRGDIAARGNFCTIGADGEVLDRRAGRITTEVCRRLCERIREATHLQDADLFIEPVARHRFLLVLRGEALGGDVSDTDPLEVGRAPLEPRGADPASQRTAELAVQVVRSAHAALKEAQPANGVLLRGFARLPELPSLASATRMRLACAAGYPMYRGVARLVGMRVLAVGATLLSHIEAVASAWDSHDLFFVHDKGADEAGEDGDFERKVAALEAADALIPRLLERRPDVLVVTGDHSTPARLAAHSWHPVPLLVWAPGTVRPDEVRRFGERACMAGGFGPRLPATAILPIALAHAGRLKRFGA